MMTSCRVYQFHFCLKKKYLNVFSIYSRHFCSASGGSKLDDDSSKEKSENEAKNVTSGKKDSAKLKSITFTDEKKEAAKQKLKSLLSDITITSEKTSKSSLNLAKPLKRISKKERLAQIEAEKVTPEKKMDMAVKAVASTFNEESEKVELELKEKLTTLNLTQKDSVVEEVQQVQPPTQDISHIDNTLNENLMSSVGEVASAISDSPIPPRSELAKRLMRISLDQKVSSDGKKSMRSVIEGMVIKKKEKSMKVSERSEKISEKFLPRAKHPAQRKIEHVNLFAATPLNIFDPSTEMKPESTNALWQKLQAKEVRLLTQFAPTSAFEEMIMWTEQGKHWKFPIDNEAEIGEEANVGFHEHVFLERHLKGFPTRGPIRHFMELVCVGLSKNPYISVERKIENIEWFRNYFKEKEELLRECGALG